MKQTTLPVLEQMTIGEDTIRDLLPLYFEGEASAGTQNLVHAWFARYPVFADEVQRGAAALSALNSLPLAPPDADHVRESLRRVHRILLLREVLHGLAMAFSVCPLLMVALLVLFPNFVPTEFRGRLLLAVALLSLLAAVSWTIYIRVRRSLQADVFK